MEGSLVKNVKICVFGGGKKTIQRRQKTNKIKSTRGKMDAVFWRGEYFMRGRRTITGRRLRRSVSDSVHATSWGTEDVRGWGGQT
jgi:hypothetical protein